VIAKVTEQILEIPVKIGDRVKTGQVVAKLDRSGPSSRYHQAESAYLNAKRSAERMQALFAAGAVSRQNLDDAETQLDVARAEFEAAKSLVDLTSSIGGIVTAIHYSAGEMTASGTPVATVAKLDELNIVLHVGESDLPFLQLGQSAEIFSELRPATRAEGVITELSRSADAATRTFEVKARFANVTEQWFHPGMFGIALIHYTTADDKLTIPRTALVNREGDFYVYLVEDNAARLQAIAIEIAGDETLAVSGLSPGMQIVTKGKNRLNEGAPVIVVSEAQFSVRDDAGSGSEQ